VRGATEPEGARTAWKDCPPALQRILVPIWISIRPQVVDFVARSGAVPLWNRFGLVSARVINNTLIDAAASGRTLAVETAGNDNDWDGVVNTGHLKASNSGTLELRDNATFPFTGTVEAAAGSRVFANGFALAFNPGSTLSLANGRVSLTKTDALKRHGEFRRPE
jgi:hypothetical protein